MQKRDGGRTRIVVIAGDRGLAGGYNANVFRLAKEYPDAEFILINPRSNIGDFIDGTLDFTAKGARKRMELGYIDAIRQLEFYGQDMSSSEVRFLYDQSVKREYNRVFVEEKKRDLEEMVNTDMDKLNSILDQYMGD